MKYLVIAIRFLGDRYHGRTENGREPEWPPSPLRLYQAVLAGAAPRWHDIAVREHEFPALEWFQSLEPPQIIAPKYERGRPLLKYVRENLSDVDPEKRDAKFSRPTLFCGEPTVTYCWSIDPEQEQRARLVVRCARHCRALGWGIDMAIGDGAVVESEPECAAGEKWLPMANVANSVPLRVPRQQSSSVQGGTLSELMNRFRASLERLEGDARSSVPPLNAFRTVGYRRSTDPAPRSVAAFSLLKPDASGFRAFDTTRRGLTVAGMMRHTAKGAAARAGWSESEINTLILGHGEAGKTGDHVPIGLRRFAYLPLPSIEPRGDGTARVVGSIRRIVLSSFSEDFETQVAWARRALSGAELIDENLRRPVALLSLIPRTDNVVRQYIQPASSWATVTPVVLPGYDDPAHYRRRLKEGVSLRDQSKYLDRLSLRVDGLLRKAIVQAGFSKVLADHVDLEWRGVGFWPGTDLANRYGVPEHLKRFPRLHVRLQWRDARKRPVQVPGPLCLGGGRFYGLGLFGAL
ncbi:MAG: type I-G CRISPR-associated protein Csb2 [Candidatus Binataceae bacterium]